MNKVIDIRERYCNELKNIEYILNNLEKGRYYENSHVKMDGCLSTNISKLRDCINDLIYKIEYNKESQLEELQKVVYIMNDLYNE